MKIENRIAIEKRIVKAIVTMFLDLGYTISVFDGEVFSVKRSSNKTEILNDCFDTDAVNLKMRDSTGEYVGTVYLVYGNDGFDVVSDYSVSLEHHMKCIEELADKLELEYN